MHELGIAEAIVRAVAAEAGERGARRVRAVDLDIAVTEGLSQESLRAAFALAAAGTVAEGAVLRVHLVHDSRGRPRAAWTVWSATMVLRDL